MNKNIRTPFSKVEIEIVEISNNDIVVTSGFWGEEEDFNKTKYYWENK